MSNDTNNDPMAAEHRAKVDAILAGTAAPPPAKPATEKPTAARAPVADGVIVLPPMVLVENNSQIAEHGHDASTGYLFLRFHSKNGPGSVYRYANFGETDYQAFLDAESKGSYFIKSIKPHTDRYPCERVQEQPAP